MRGAGGSSLSFGLIWNKRCLIFGGAKCFLLLQNPNIVISTTVFTIGSNKQCNFPLKEQSISGHLCKIKRTQVLMRVKVLTFFFIFIFYGFLAVHRQALACGLLSPYQGFLVERRSVGVRCWAPTVFPFSLLKLNCVINVHAV